MIAARQLLVVAALAVLTVGAKSQTATSTQSDKDLTLARQQNVSIVLFDPGIPEDASTHRQLGVFPAVRKVEALFLPFVLRQILEQTDSWGAVRVVPERSVGDEVTVTGTINQSNGEVLEVTLTATDASGAVWASGQYAMTSGTADPNRSDEISTSFRRVFERFAQDLDEARASRGAAELTRNRDMALLRYAANLLPQSYQSYFTSSADGRLMLSRLPAQDDPMLGRIRRIRDFEYQFIDTIDEQYEALYSQTENSYNLWLRYQERLTRYRITGEQRRQNRSRSQSPGSYNAMRESYEQYRWLKMEEQNLRNWARGFKNEVAPTVVEVEGRIVSLDGSLNERYDEWRRLLGALFEQEVGVAP